MVNLNDLIGKSVDITITTSSKAFYTVTLHGVEQGGLWIEGGVIHELLGYEPNRKLPASKIAKRPVLFLPYAQIGFLLSSSIDLDEPALQGN